MCVCVVCVFVIEENMFYFAMVMCELRCELGGGVGGREGGKVVLAEYWISVAIPTLPPGFDIDSKLAKIAFNFLQSCQKENPDAGN